MDIYFNAGDLDFFWKEHILSLSWLPQVYVLYKDFGISGLLNLWLAYPFTIVLKLLSSVGFSWWMIEKMLWCFIFALGIVSSYKLTTYICSNSRISFLSPLIYMGNTYFLLLFGGGQMGIALAYSVSPFVLLKFIQYIDDYIQVGGSHDRVWKKCIQNGLLLALLICFDLRLSCLVVGMVILYLLFRRRDISMFSVALHTFGIPFLMVLLIHMFWILPTVMVREGLSAVGSEFTHIGMLRFLSVADFSHAISLLHPNWPENLFGKVYFMQLEFLILPIVAFSSLLWIEKKSKNYELRTMNYELILFFTLLALIGAFLAKGSQEPFGGIYIWLFEHFPGFMMFRDPTKFYILTALSYAVLIPYSLKCVRCQILGVKNLDKKVKRMVSTSVIVLFLGFWCFTIRPLFLGQLTGNFRPIQLTNEFIRLKDLLLEDSSPSRTLWLPKPDKFMYASNVHPVLSGETFYKNASVSAMTSYVKEPEFQKMIDTAGVKYIIVSLDLEKRMFLSDYVFNPKEREMLVQAISKTGLYRLPEFKDLAVFENKTFIFHEEIPDFVKKQEYWSNIGVIVSIMSLTGFILIFLFKKK